MCNLFTGLLWHRVELFLHIAELKTLAVVFHVTMVWTLLSASVSDIFSYRLPWLKRSDVWEC
jgi:hypothetical protein